VLLRAQQSDRNGTISRAAADGYELPLRMARRMQELAHDWSVVRPHVRDMIGARSAMAGPAAAIWMVIGIVYLVYLNWRHRQRIVDVGLIHIEGEQAETADPRVA
jgi:hypothetical protein